MQRCHERANLTIACLVVRQKLKLIAAVKVQQSTARQAIFTHDVQFVEGEYALDKVFPQYRIVQATVFFDG